MSKKINEKWNVKIKFHNKNESISKMHKHFMFWYDLIKMQETSNLWTQIGDKKYLNLKLVPNDHEDSNELTITYTCDYWEDVLN